MKPTFKNPDWQKDCLLAANQQLEADYQRAPSACLALQISRNYRLLLTQFDQPSMKARWQALSISWWEAYCQLRQVSAQPLFLTI
jgi:hypothetical protein